jgi:hypothetical protein
MRSGLLVLVIAGCAPKLDCAKGTHWEDYRCVNDPLEVGEGTTELGNVIQLAWFPPVVVRTDPPSGAIGVDPALDTIEVVFSNPMFMYSWSWVTDGTLAFPPLTTVSWRLPTVHVGEVASLQPDQGYLAWINDPYGQYDGFIDEFYKPAVPYPIVFHTGDGADPAVLADAPGAVVQTVPEAGEDGVDPALDRIEVTFSKDRDPAVSAWVVDQPSTFPTLGGEGSDEPRTTWVEVDLEPSTTYALWIGREDEVFVDAWGLPFAPYLLTFRTAAE